MILCDGTASVTLQGEFGAEQTPIPPRIRYRSYHTGEKRGQLAADT